MAEGGAKIQYTEGSPWFWKIFGGAIVGVISILLLTHITSINSNIDRSFLSLRSEIKDVLTNLDSQKERVVSLEQHKEQCRERQVNLEKTLSQVQVSLDEARAKIATNDAQIAALKDDLKSLREWNKELSKQLQEIREKLAASHASKKSDNPVE